MSDPDPSPGPPPDLLVPGEATRRESQELFTKSFHSSPALMTIAALPGGEFVEVNEAFLKAVGRSREEVIGQTTLDLNLWCNPQQREEFIAQISQNITVRDYEAEFNSGSGQPRFYLLNADRIEIKGRPCILTVAFDINERRRRLQAEEALRYVERRYRNLFENAAEGLYLSTPEGKFLEVNPALARMFGYDSPADCIHSINTISAEVYVDPSRRDQFFQELHDLDRVTDFESQVRRRDGTKFWVSESVRAVRDAEGNLLHLEGVAVDITARRKTAAALAQALEDADSANRAKSQFLASMSHELRTPLNGILGFTQVLRRHTDLTNEQQHGLGVIHESAEHLLSLINDVLDLSKIESGRFELQPTSFDLPALLAGVAELLAPQARAQGITFRTETSGDLPARITTDAARLRQVLLNLVANAIKFTRDGSVTLEAHSAPSPGDTVRVRFGVRDTGTGIPANEITRMFEPFEQLDNDDAQREGTGLGLAISHRLVKALGGSLSVQSTPGKGSTFWFDLDLPVADETTTPFETHTPISGYEGPPKRVLVVDDLAANADVLANLLQPIGFDVRVVDSGEAALAAIEESLPDLILMDLRMPGIGGLEAIKRIRALPGGDEVRCVAVSASAYDFDREQALKEGCDDFLPKPVRAEQLLDCVGRLLQLTWQHQTLASGTAAPFSELAEPPPAEEVESIYQLALSGDVVALRERAENLLAEHPEHQAFAEDVLELARGFKLKALRKMLQPLREGTGDDS